MSERTAFIVYSVAKPRSRTARLESITFHGPAARAHGHELREQIGWYGIIVRAYGPEEHAPDTIKVVAAEVETGA